MPAVCPATGHVLENVRGPRCQTHGVAWFSHCGCGAEWPTESLIRRARSAWLNTPRGGPEKGSPFCAECGTPAPWLGRVDLMSWVRHQVQASEDVSAADRVELVAVLDRIRDMDPGDNRAVAGWKRLHELAPRVYAATKPARDALMSEGVKRALDGLLGAG